MLKSQQYPIKLLLRIFIFLAISIVLLAFTSLQYRNQIVHIIHTAYTIILIFSLFYEIFNTIPRIRFYDDRLIIKTLTNKKTYWHTDIEKIVYTDREHWFHLLRKVYSACIFFKNGDFVFVHQNLCKNYATIEQHLKTIIISESPMYDKNIMRYFKGSIVYSMLGAVNIPLTFTLLQIIDNSLSQNQYDLLFLIFLLILALLIFSVNVFVVGISKDKLYVKNHLTILFFNRYRLDDLINVRYETIGKLTRIRIWRKNNEWKRYYFFTLSNRTLRELAIVLRARGVQVIDDVTL